MSAEVAYRIYKDENGYIPLLMPLDVMADVDLYLDKKVSQGLVLFTSRGRMIRPDRACKEQSNHDERILAEWFWPETLHEHFS
ncbi:hypothetical protein KOR42_23550 [Thalassoglobus neptunius]|uniref:Uncharacterized protein n=1 Tax=Thalassoglobus neptunius TaxID=1938619 RepID=A0A5C5X816_9PLAN|nr:hypothetical protein [Thalassoglobus neptunius]TWT58968.1 hypothetical protein KOR42_23550 [Thalassoglobus neptunius]